MIYRKNNNLVTRKIAGETIIVPIRGELANMSRIFALSGIGEAIWDLLDGKRNFDDICDNIVKEYEATRDEIEADAREFMEQLLKAGLITTAG